MACVNYNAPTVKISSPKGTPNTILKRGERSFREARTTQSADERKVLWKNNTIRTNRSNLRLRDSNLDSKAANRVIARKKKETVKNRALASIRVAAANRAAVSNLAEDKPCIAN